MLPRRRQRVVLEWVCAYVQVAAEEYAVARMSHVGGGGGVAVRTKARRTAVAVIPGEDPPPAALTALGGGGGGGGRGGSGDGGSRGGGGRGRVLPERRVGGVLIDLATPLRLHRTQVLQLVREHLRNNIVRAGGVYLLQTVGIPQVCPETTTPNRKPQTRYTPTPPRKPYTPYTPYTLCTP